MRPEDLEFIRSVAKDYNLQLTLEQALEAHNVCKQVREQDYYYTLKEFFLNCKAA